MQAKPVLDASSGNAHSAVPGPAGPPRRVGLLTLPLLTNYGGILQAVALHHALTSLGKDVVLLERNRALSPRVAALVDILQRLPFLGAAQRVLPPAGSSGGLSAKVRTYLDMAAFERKVARHHPFAHRVFTHRSGTLRSSRDMADAVDRLKLDAIVVGSDQVWRLDYVPKGSEEDFFLGFAPTPSVRKISYAASFGRAEWAFPSLTARIGELLARFDAVSVRERSGIAICADSLGRQDVHHVVDPTLLVEPGFYDTLVPSRGGRNGKTLLSYVLDEAPDRPFVSSEVHASLGSDYTVRRLTLDDGKRSVDVPGWLRAFMDADFVVTDSFHGMVFSIIFRKPFIAIVNQHRGADRFTSLLDLLGLRHRLVFQPTREELRTLAREPIAYQEVETRLSALRERSLAFLRQALQ